ncbi:MAG: hypothetical protein Q7R73_01815 [bacterium]|nr:hypothetical protein [bacterium]
MRRIYLSLGLGFFLFALAYVLVIFTPVDRVFWWYDEVAHMTGGIWAAFFSMSVFAEWRRREFISFQSYFVYIACIIAFVFMIGVVWEWYEFGLDEYFILRYGHPRQMELLDTLGDLGSDVVGAAVFLLWKTKRKNFI